MGRRPGRNSKPGSDLESVNPGTTNRMEKYILGGDLPDEQYNMWLEQATGSDLLTIVERIQSEKSVGGWLVGTSRDRPHRRSESLD